MAAPDLPGAVRLARARDAELFVIGRLTGTGPRLHIEASLYDRRQRHPDHPVVQADAEGDSRNAVGLAREVARQLLAARADAGDIASSSLPAGTTLSLDALRTYLEGERLFQQLEIANAIHAYRQAIRIDSTFSTAWYRIGDAALWYLRSDVAQVAADSALHFASTANSGDHDRLRGFRAMTYGQIIEAEASLRGGLWLYPRNAETRFLLADLLFHFNWLRGRSSEESRSLFETLRRDEPGDWRPLFHLWDLAMAGGHLETAEALRDSLAVMTGAADLFVDFDAIRQFGQSDSIGRSRVLDSLRPLDQWQLANVVSRYTTLTHDIPGARLLAALLTGPERPSEVQATGHLFLAILALAEGRWHQAEAEAARGAALNPVVRDQWALLALSPAIPSSAAVRAERRRLNATMTTLAPIPLKAPYWPWTDLDRHEAAAISPYLHARLTLATRKPGTIASWRRPPPRPGARQDALSSMLSFSLGAAVAMEQDSGSVAL